MEWLDNGIVLSARPHGENAAVVTLLTAEHGKHAGLVPGGQGNRAASLVQPGNLVQAKWRARLLDHLGNFTLDLIASQASGWLDEAQILSLIASACAITESALPERQPMPGVYAALAALFAQKDLDLWGPLYVRYEMGLLQSLGYGLDLSRCAVSGETTELSHVSPRTGRAVTKQAAAPYKERLLVLPSFLSGGTDWAAADILQGLELTGHFLARHVFANPHSHMLVQQAGELPLARQRLTDYYRRQIERDQVKTA